MKDLENARNWMKVRERENKRKKKRTTRCICESVHLGMRVINVISQILGRHKLRYHPFYHP